MEKRQKLPFEPENECENCKHYDTEEKRCGAFVCTPLGCPDLQCEKMDAETEEAW